MASAAAGSTVLVHGGGAVAAHQETFVTKGRSTEASGRRQPISGAGFDGTAVAAIGTGLTGAGWLLMRVASRQLRRRSR